MRQERGKQKRKIAWLVEGKLMRETMRETEAETEGRHTEPEKATNERRKER